MEKPLVLIIMDGWGIRREKKGNAILNARTPNYDFLMKNYPHSTLFPYGKYVGLPDGFIGNSEVGHLNIGAGRIVYQELTRISKAIKNKSFFKNMVLLNVLDNVKKNKSCLHLIGLLSDAGVHSHINHLFALLNMAKSNGIKNVYVHVITDGRDTLPGSAKKYIKSLEKELSRLRIGKIATVIGRYYAMDRNKSWARLKKAYDTIAYGNGLKSCSALEAFDNALKKGETDEFISPTAIAGYNGINKNDSMIFFNFRSDRAREICHAFTDKKFKFFKIKSKFNLMCMCEYDKKIKAPVAFPPPKIKNNLGQVLSKNGLRQLRIAETEKYAHVTFFFNSGIEKPNSKEDRIIIPSPKVATYDLKPEMSAYKVRNECIKKIKSKKYNVIIINFANPDMVGHTGIIDAAVKAVEITDDCVGDVIREIQKLKGTVLITADHGNCEEMIGKRKTSHTTNKVPFILVSGQKKKIRLRNGILADIAPTMLDILKIKKPKEMTGKSLISSGLRDT
ncbi:2,3-bisphosphoglycerate-independent phosphoglycerate mutase [Candidatus Woesearchaeota archaeon CG_4_10_14_0_2_um_filter_33_10]|nr:MAG: phosphoglycerate mutase (2,3-diphosphoglycerate-independent) [Candidatus Woesearchaeota archaeon CG1_02_33_12]PIN77574.1 MAG: phosphoglycerate mutase (2,3-diphosphoglycerate-independent) [Candidatus Woesearchaeota archaeon CG10_big_fil_rev_8_21_14_0_10_33_12]PIU72460.1 MAG: 2,3-bisphosphoglycerate-independent phosphoglycerate mutase [Candidatus Woesearchaeota archaeon CG06_land_8_20_14_3_00_33_13]PIZ53451.1 MAG: 2,3-bisphosphoglycerate-independent phosphoglycerate mutase [Candidatus Woes